MITIILLGLNIVLICIFLYRKEQAKAKKLDEIRRKLEDTA